MNPDLLDTLLSIAVGLATLVGVVWGAWLTFRKWIRRKLKPYADARDALVHMPAMRRAIEGISYHVAPNGGGSLADSSRRIEEGVTALHNRVGLIESTSRAMLDTNPAIATYECDATGQVITANRTYARWLGVDKRELLGWGYLNSVHPADVDDVREEWTLARTEHREYRHRIRFVAVGGQIVTMDVTATPIPDVAPAQRWVGVMRMVPNAE